MYKFKEIIKSAEDFELDVINEVRNHTGDVEWLNDANKYYKLSLLYFVIRNQYNERYVRYDKEEFMGYFYNKFVTYTPMFYAKVSNIIEDKISELQVNANVGKKTKLTSNTKRAQSTQPYNNTIGTDISSADEKNQTDYNLETGSENMIENAKRLSQARINGEVEKYVNSFADLFTSIDMGEQLEGSFTTPMRDLLIHVANIVDGLGNIKPVPVSKWYKSEQDFATKALDGEIGRFEENAGQSALLLKTTNGIVAKFKNVVEIQALIDALKNQLQTEIVKNENNILALIQTMLSKVYLDKDFATTQVGTLSSDGKTLTFPHDFTTLPTDGDIGELHLTNADESISFNLPFKYNGSISTTFYKTLDDKDTLTVTVDSNHITFVATKANFFGSNGFKIVKAYGTGSAKVDLSMYLTKNEGNTLYAPKVYDFSGSDSTLTFNETNGKRYQIITKPAGDTAPVGGEVKLLVKNTATDANELPQDTDQITYGADLLWINKATTDIMSWAEIKDSINAGKTMVITKLEDGHYQLVRWESIKEYANTDLSNTWIKKSTKVAIASSSGTTNQGNYAIAIGTDTGHLNQTAYSIAIGAEAGYDGQHGGIAIGRAAGHEGQGNNAIAIGTNAGYLDQPDNSIVMSTHPHTKTPTGSNEILLVTPDTEVKMNRLGIFLNGVKVGSGGSGSGSAPAWKDITATWTRRAWKNEDVGKMVRITAENGNTVYATPIIKIANAFFGEDMLNTNTTYNDGHPMALALELSLHKLKRYMLGVDDAGNIKETHVSTVAIEKFEIME